MSTPNLGQVIIEPARSVAGNADFLSLAVAKQDRDQIENAVDDLVRSYDRYAGHAANQTIRLKFDDVAKMDNPEERDQGTANTLASALVDIQMAVLLSQAAQAVGELGGETSASEINEAAERLNQTVDALQGTPGLSGQNRLAFDGVAAARPEQTVSSLDLPTAKKAFRGKTKDIYEKMLSESELLWLDMFTQFSGLDQKQIQEGLNVIKNNFNVQAVGKVVPKILDALQRATKTMKELIGEEGLQQLDEKITKAIEAIKQGEGTFRIFLKYSFQSEEGQQMITAWVDASQGDIASIDKGTKRLTNLEQQAMQTFSVSKKIVTNLKTLTSPITWVLRKVGSSLPVDLLLAGIYCLIGGATLLRIMDYADTTTVVKFVDGTLTISKQALGVTD